MQEPPWSRKQPWKRVMRDGVRAEQVFLDRHCGSGSPPGLPGHCWQRGRSFGHQCQLHRARSHCWKSLAEQREPSRAGKLTPGSYRAGDLSRTGKKKSCQRHRTEQTLEGNISQAPDPFSHRTAFQQIHISFSSIHSA